MTAHIAHGELVVVLNEVPDNTFDALLCDPPYGFDFMGKAWDYDVPRVEDWAACAGAGSEMIGALKAGWPYVFGIEREADYLPIARARLAHWCGEAA